MFILFISFKTIKKIPTELDRPLRSQFRQAGAPGSIQEENAKMIEKTEKVVQEKSFYFP